ncbi:unnamed protein product [Cylicostephanus goldi]|uniref:P-type domain-containing protein n=1 Tax=Cylicostephanus goldi TaxID=71465 RepID=A0A3P6T0R1_CYLGO|nr:unnamed protein product [Cylicostephanus goldi]
MRHLPYLLFLGLTRSEDVRIDCHPEPGASKKQCESRDCIWSESTAVEGIPYCYMKPGIGYKFLSAAAEVVTLTKNDGPKNPWGEDFEQILFTHSYIGKTLNVKIYAPNR